MELLGQVRGGAGVAAGPQPFSATTLKTQDARHQGHNQANSHKSKQASKLRHLDNTSVLACSTHTSFFFWTGASLLCLAQSKLDKLRAQILGLLEHKRVPRKDLESCLGLLMWATSVSSHLRCFAAPLYADLHSPPGTQSPIPPRSWPQFLWCLDSQCRVTRDASFLQLPIKAKVIEVKEKPGGSA